MRRGGVLVLLGSCTEPLHAPLLLEALPTDAARPGVELRFELVQPGPAVARCTAQSDPAEVHIGWSERVGEVHELALYGLLPDEEYVCLPSTGGRVGAAVSVRTLPLDLPPLERVGDVSWGAYTVFALSDGTRNIRVLVVDPQGRVRWSWSDYLADGTMDLCVEARDSELAVGAGGRPLRVLDAAGRRRSDVVSPALGERFHHELSWLEDGTLLALSDVENTDGATSWEGFGLEVHDPRTGALTWSWSSQRAVDDGVLHVPGPDGEVDPYHANAATWTHDRVYVSLRRRSRILNLDPATGVVEWQLGRGGDFELLDASGAPAHVDEWFHGQHDPHVEGDRVLVHDNLHTRADGVLVSRVVDLELDEVARTARIAWTWTEPGWSWPFFGGVRRLPNGHALIAQGRCLGCGRGDRPASIVEVDPVTDEVVWRLDLPDIDTSLYRARRVDGCALFANAGLCQELEG